MSAPRTLLLRLDGPMQSWGVDSRFGIRDTRREPTKSGVIGLLASALGRERSEPVDDLAALTFGVRVDREGQVLRDFQTASFIYRAGSNPERARKKWARIKSGELTINDKDRDFKLTDPSSRFYLADACFTAGFEAQTEEEHALLDQMHAALLSPRWPLFLGRRAFPPAAPVVLEIAEAGLLDALRRAPSPPLDGANRPRTDSGAARYVLDADAEAPDAPRRLAGADVPVSFQSDRRRHRTRETITLTLPIAS